MNLPTFLASSLHFYNSFSLFGQRAPKGPMTMLRHKGDFDLAEPRDSLLALPSLWLATRPHCNPPDPLAGLLDSLVGPTENPPLCDRSPITIVPLLVDNLDEYLWGTGTR